MLITHKLCVVDDDTSERKRLREYIYLRRVQSRAEEKELSGVSWIGGENVNFECIWGVEI